MKAWLIAYYVLFAGIVLTGALNMLHVHGGFLTNHLADIIVPAWMYIAARGRYSTQGRVTRPQRTIGRSPATAAVFILVASTITEVSQYYWPHGIFSGRFDPMDIVAYAGGLAVCYAVDTQWPAPLLNASNSEQSAAG